MPNPINWKQNFKLLMDLMKHYARQWSKREEVRSLIQIRIKKLQESMSTKALSVFNNPQSEKFVVVPADKASLTMYLFVKNTTLIA